jgi:hypothetical protein
MSLSTLTGTAGLVLGAMAGLLVGGLTTYVAWTWRADTIRDLETENERWKSSSIIAEQKAQTAQRDSQTAIDQLLKLLVETQDQYREKFDAISAQLESVASTTRRALSAPAVKLLNDGPSARRAEAHKDPLAILGLTPRPATAPAGPPADDDGSGASEYELARWVNFARCSHVRQKAVTEFLQGAVKAAPQCFEVVDDGGPDYWDETAMICARK